MHTHMGSWAHLPAVPRRIAQLAARVETDSRPTECECECELCRRINDNASLTWYAIKAASL